MLLKRKGFPQEDELVLCTVTAVHYHSVFVTLDEYNKTGLIHISEIAPGRIRNIRDYVVENKKVVCKVLKIDKEKGHIDLSLRRVNEKQKRTKLNQIKQEQLAENIIIYLAKQQKKKPEELYQEIISKLFEKYDSLFTAFEEASQDKMKLEDFLNKKLSSELITLIKQRIKPKQIEIGGEIKISSTASNGVEVVKDILKKVESLKGKSAIKYKGAGIYSITIQSDDYKEAEKILKQAIEKAEKESKKQKATFEFKRTEKE
ncbi:S1 RNA-binding domain-containing protein [Candidatus Woesearchaeota archaeon]|nr:S1 RNA-binding domain-containing protein [Candidatus Woesearchaeota archaeon]MBW2978581.1 S1 RNA-binding domain-containing protein [Candidatus Woesearchaeota archaeon]